MSLDGLDGLREWARKENQRRQMCHEKREAGIADFLSRLDWEPGQLERYQASVAAFGERYRRVVARYPKAPRLFR